QRGIRCGNGAEGLAGPERHSQCPAARRIPCVRGEPEVGVKRRGTSLARAVVRAPISFERLHAGYPEAKTARNHPNPFQLLVATILSAQTTDVRVNLVTPELFARYPDAAALARARQSDVEKLVQSTGFFRNKAKSIIGMAQAVVADYGGEVPNAMEQ